MEYIQADIWVRFQRMQGHAVHFVGADDAHGAPIMLKAEAEGITPEELVRAHRRRAAAVSRRLSPRASITGTRRTRPRTSSCRPDIYRKLQGRGPDLRQAGRAVLRSGEEDVPGRTATSRASARTATRRISTAMPARSAARSYSPTDLINPYSTLSGATPVRKTSDHYFFRLSDPKCVEFLKSWLDAPGRLQPSVVEQGARMADAAAAIRSSATGTSRATRPTSAFRFRMRPANISMCGSMRRSAISPR